jgi:hypothetical protein
LFGSKSGSSKIQESRSFVGRSRCSVARKTIVKVRKSRLER